VTSWIALAAAAVLLFWIVGAYNRVVRLRTALVAAFLPVEAAHRDRQDLLERQTELVGAAIAAAAPRVEALGAALRQAASAREHARRRPGAASAVTSLRLADEILADARGRLPVPSLGGPDLPELGARLAAADLALAGARRDFNAAVATYNGAVVQFPTLLVAALFGFRTAGTF
jgi:LemA protein